MNEIDMRPISPFGIVDKDDPNFYLTFYPFPMSAFDGCPFCQSPMIARSRPVCSNPECFKWKVEAGSIFYDDKISVFEIKNKDREVCIFTDADFGGKVDIFRNFYKDLFFKILIANNVYYDTYRYWHFKLCY